MKLFRIFLLLAIVITAFSSALSAQEKKFKFGEIDQEELSMKVYPKDTSAAAVILGTTCNIKIEYDVPSGQFLAVYTRFYRIKIFNKNGYDWADHKISLYDYGGLEETVTSFKAQTYNLTNGKVVKSKISRGDLIDNRENMYYNSKSFTMPDVQDNCIIEFEYGIKSNYLRSLHEWYFQETIPVAWSELRVEIPEYYNYKPIMSGYEALAVRETKMGRGMINYTSRETSVSGRTTDYSANQLNYTTKIDRMVGIDMPAFISEPMLTSFENYISKIEFELESTMFPNTSVKYFTESWESINKNLLESQNFGYQLDGGAYLNDVANSIKSAYQDPSQRIAAAHTFIKNHMKWNGYSGIFSTGSLRSAFNDRAGSAADINLMLVVLLKKLDFNANPVILSTRSNGLLNPFFPSATKSNYTIAHVILDNKTVLLDATEPLLPAGQLPERCLNGQGRLIVKGSGDWVNLDPGLGSEYSSVMRLKLSPTGELSGTISNVRKDYSAFRFRRSVADSKSQEEFIRDIETSNPELEIVEFKFSDLDSLNKPVIETYIINITGSTDQTPDMIYLNPMFLEKVRINPFKIKERKYPIDFSYRQVENYTLLLEIPEGYIFEELPESIKYVIPGNTASFLYVVAASGNVLRLNYTLNINKVVFLSDEYTQIKELFNKIVEKHAEQIVIKRTL